MHSLALGLGRKTKQCAREDIFVQICEGVCCMKVEENLMQNQTR